MARISPALLTLLFLFASMPVYGITKQNPHADFDIRYSRNIKAVKNILTVQRIPFGQTKQAEQQLARTIPGLSVKYHSALGGPEIVGVQGGHHYLTAPSSVAREAILRSFLTDNSALYGLTAQQIAGLITIANYENPSGNFSWVKLQQTINGIPVFRGELRAAFTSKGELVRTVSELVPDVEPNSLSTSPSLSADQAAAMAAQSVGSNLTSAKCSSELQYFPVRSGIAILAWSIILRDSSSAYCFVIDAQNGELLFRKSLINDASQTATYGVYENDSPSPLSPTSATPGSGIQGNGVARSIFALISELPAFDNDGWIPDGSNTTTGNNVDAGLDLDKDQSIDANGRAIGSPFRVFNFSYDPPPIGSDDATDADLRMGAVTNAFFWANRYHDLLYQLGFTEADGNFQTNNFGRGGSANDAVIVYVQRVTDNASFFTPQDGTPGEMSLGIWPGPTPDRDGALDQEVTLHELTHGLSNRLHGNARGLHLTQSQAMGEGWSDFYARSILSDGSENPNALYAFGAYSTLDFMLDGKFLGSDNYYYGIRRFPYAVRTNVGPNGKPHSPLTLADIDSSKLDTSDGAFPESPILWSSNGAGESHNAGEVWCSALLEVRARLISTLGFNTGNQRMLQLTTDAMKLDPANPSFLEGRDSILAADCASNNGADESNIWAGFAARGMGFEAQLSPSFYLVKNTVVESFKTPNVQIGTVDYSEPKKSTGVCQNGFADPGEKLDLTIPYSNPFCAKNISQVVANIVGNPGPAKNYGNIAAGATVTRVLNYKIPANAVCGSQSDVSVVAKSNLGTITNHFPLQIGKPVIAFSENFDAAIPPALPPGWTTSATFTLPVWITSNAESSSAPNSAFVMEEGNTGDSELVSPAIPITSANAQLIFRHHVNIKSASDGILKISIAGGSFEEIEAAGGTFLNGAYNTSNSWSEDSRDFFVTTVQLPPSAAGESVQFRWTLSASSSGPPKPGWFIDDIQIIDGYTCCP
jgi:hypothetical protein